MPPDAVKLSKFLSLVLRHRPELLGLSLGPQGWVTVDELITRSAAKGQHFSRETLQQIVETNDKKRFTLSADGQHIRAAQGHSVEIDLGLSPAEPPAMLYHGTATRFLGSILSQGLRPQSRHHVHLSADAATAHRVGQRHGEPVVLKVQAASMHAEGFSFFIADNGVWLTDHVPPRFVEAFVG